MTSVDEHLDRAEEELASLKRSAEQCSIAFIDALRALNGELSAALANDMAVGTTARLKAILDQRHLTTADFYLQCEVKKVRE